MQYTPDTAARPCPWQNFPAGQGRQELREPIPDWGRKVPLGQGCGSGLPGGQKCPAGHRPPVPSPTGSGTRAWEVQKCPGQHGPLGAESPKGNGHQVR